MADLHTYKKLPSDPCLSEEQILAYIDARLNGAVGQGKLSSAEQHACEAHMADCAMCEDAVEGIALVKDRSLLAAPLKVDAAPSEGKVVPLHQPKRKLWYAAAAILVVILGSTFLLNIISSDEATSEDMAYNSEVVADSSFVAAPGEGYAVAEEEKAADEELKNTRSESGKDIPNESEKKAVAVGATDANEGLAYEEPVAPVVREDAEEDYVVDLKAVEDNSNDGDDEVQDRVAKPEVVATKDGSGPKTETDKSKEESKEKKNLFDIASGVAGGAKRAEGQKSKKDGYVDDNRKNDQQNNPGAPNTNTPVVTQNETQQAPQTVAGNAGAGSPSFDNGPVDSVSVSLSEVTTISSRDSIVVADQLELSYQNGLSMLNAGQTANAIVMFDKVLTNKNHARYEDAEFQKAKALIKAGKKEEAKTLLKSIEAKKGKHAVEATELLKTI